MGSVARPIVPVRPEPTRKPVSAAAPAAVLVNTTARDPRQTGPIYMSPTWQAGPPPAAASTSTSVPVRPPSGQADYNRGNATIHDDVRCQCNAPAIEKTVVSEIATKGKRFWKCATGGCGFFQWLEEMPSSSNSSTIPVKRPYPAVSTFAFTDIWYLTHAMI